MGITDITSLYGTTNTSNVTATKKSGSDLSMDDFFQLLTAQLKNQNMMDPVDNTEFIAQMAQFSTLSQMKELSAATQTTYAVTLMGKTVTVSVTDDTGVTKQHSGTVDSVSFENGVPRLNVGGSSYAITDIKSIKG